MSSNVTYYPTDGSRPFIGITKIEVVDDSEPERQEALVKGTTAATKETFARLEANASSSSERSDLSQPALTPLLTQENYAALLADSAANASLIAEGIRQLNLAGLLTSRKFNELVADEANPEEDVAKLEANASSSGERRDLSQLTHENKVAEDQANPEEDAVPIDKVIATGCTLLRRMHMLTANNRLELTHLEEYHARIVVDGISILYLNSEQYKTEFLCKQEIFDILLVNGENARIIIEGLRHKHQAGPLTQEIIDGLIENLNPTVGG